MSGKSSVILFMCMIALPSVAGAAIQITEIMYDPEGTDTKREWIEIYNAGSESVDLAKYKFIDKSNHALNAPPKNGGTGSLVIAAGSYAVLAADGTTFAAENPGIAYVIDTVMTLKNTGATISLSNGETVVDSALYTKSHGADGNGSSLQLHEGAWIAAKPTPGAKNATTPIVMPVAKSATPVSSGSAAKKVAVAATRVAAEEISDPLAIVNATPTESMEQTAAVGSLEGSVWWIALAALAIGTGAAASLISRSKKLEWDIEESE